MRHRLARALVVVLASLAGTGCASVYVTYHSDPDGAMLYANADQTLFGHTPVKLKYQAGREFLSGAACQVFEGAMVRWASGAEARIENIQLCPATGRNQQYVFVRPVDAPGREQDVAMAINTQNQTLLQEQADEARRQAALRSLERAAAGGRPLPSSSAPLYSGEVVESRIDGTFEGWTGDTVFLLQNGQIWKQDRYAYTYHYAYSPKVVIYRASLGYQLKVDGVAETIAVVRLK